MPNDRTEYPPFDPEAACELYEGATGTMVGIAGGEGFFAPTVLGGAALGVGAPTYEIGTPEERQIAAAFLRAWADAIEEASKL